MSYHVRAPLVLETKADGDQPDVEKAITDLTSAFETKMGEVKAELKSHKDRADALEIKLNRPGPQERKDGEPTPERKAFVTFVRRGRDHLDVEEIKALRVADDSKGGYLAPGEFTTELLKDIVQFSPVRAAARVGSMSTGELKIPRRTSTITAQWVGEIEERNRTEPAYGTTEIVAHEMSCYVDVSNQLLEDAAIDIEAELSFDFAEEFGRLEGAAFVNGSGIKQPFGIMSDPTVPTVNSGAANGITGDGLIDVFYALQPAYRGNGAWMMNGRSVATIRKLKDGQGNYLWQPGLSAGQPATVLGRPVVEAIDMPDIAPGATPILYGDIASAYRIYDRVGLSVLRNPFTLDIYGQTRFTARRRVAGAVVRPDAIRKLKIAVN